jgi:hypothetical protein
VIPAFVRIQDIQLTLTQGESSSASIWVLHDQNGNTVDLSATTGQMVLANSPRQYDGSFYTTLSLPIAFSNTGMISLNVTSADSANVYPGDYLFQVFASDSSNNVSQVVSGIMTIKPNLGVAPLPSANASGNTNIFPANPSGPSGPPTSNTGNTGIIMSLSNPAGAP